MKDMVKIQKQWWAALLLAIIAFVVPTVVLAEDGDFDSPRDAITWYQKGQGCIHFKIQMWNYSPDRTLDYSTFYVKDSKGVRTDVFYVHENSSAANRKNNALDAGQVSFRNYLPDESKIYMTNCVSWKPLCFVGNSSTYHYTRNSKTDNGYAEFDWYYPARFSGQTMTFGVDGKLFYEYNSKTGVVSRKDYQHELGLIEFDEITLEIFDAFPSPEAGEAGMLRIPFVSNREVRSVQVSYRDSRDSLKTLDRVTIENGNYSGFLTVPATDVHKNLTITAGVVTGKPNLSDVPNPEWPKENVCDVSTMLAKAPMLHDPHLLTATLQTDSACQASMLLKWTIQDSDYDDALDGDMFLVQRSLTGRLEDFVNIGSVDFDNSETEYEFSDETFISALTPELIDAKLGIPLVRYRVQRASTQQLWSMNRNPTVAYAMPRLKTLMLVRPKDVEAAWSDEESRQVKVAWNYDKSEEYMVNSALLSSCTYVWDDRAKMSVVTQMYDRNGTLVDSLSRELTTQERQARQLELTLNRSCVSYDVRLVVDSKTSPIGQATGNLIIAIRSQDDWNNFANRVNKGETTLNAILIDKSPNISEESQMVGTEKNPYRGIFIGNNFIVNLDMAAALNKEYIAPFRFVADGATIANLITKVTIETSRKFASGIVGKITSGTVFLESCEVEMRLTSNVNGDGTHGALVACIDGDQSLFASNCLVTGSFYGDKTNNSGGLVGWLRNTAFAVMDRCYFDPYRIDFNPQGSFTLVRAQATAEVGTILRDCYYTKSFGKMQGRLATEIPPEFDWKLGNRYPNWEYYSFKAPLSRNEFSASLPSGNFYYENHGKVTKNSLRVTPQRSSAVLEWGTDDRAVDYFEVMRRQVGSDEKFEPVSPKIIDTQYEDRTTSPVHTYEYFVRSANDCEGLSYEYSDTIVGGCQQTGTVEGYVQFPDGTGISNRQVTITQDFAGGMEFTTTTDIHGHFIMADLPYWGPNLSGAYRVSPNVSGTGMQSITFGTKPGSNYVSNVRFEVTSNVKFSGYVQYDGTSIPVQGVHFLVDGIEACTAAGPVESDHEGKFSFRMLPGNHNIQAVKDGHKFYDGGWYYADEQNKSSKDYDFQTDKAGIYFYDQTRVKLTGRIVGGRDQAALPLDNSLSRNNLGDDLKMVFVLEGDNVSRLVYDILDRTKKSDSTVYVHNAHDKKFKYQTKVYTTEHRVEVYPDVHTGEYVVLLPPVKWKIQQITAKGYPTLFQDGMINDVIDLTDSLTEHRDVMTGEWVNANGDPVTQVTETYYAKYNRIYHSPAILDRRQLGYDKFSYFGDKAYTAKNMVGDRETVSLAYAKERIGSDGQKHYDTHYTFGYPVFNIEREYPVKISAVEKYYYNNNTKSDTVDVIKLSGGVVTIQNNMVSTTHRDTVHLDSLGERVYMLTAKQTPYNLTGKDALRTVTMTLELDGTNYEAEPLQAYVLNLYNIPGAKDVLPIKQPQIIDILRDPPGGGSSAKLSKGSTLKHSYTMDLQAKVGLSLSFQWGAESSFYVGFVGIGAETGTINGAKNKLGFNIDMVVSGMYKDAYSYTITCNEDISTSSDKTMVGADADVYIGTETNLILRPAVAVRAIPHSMWKKQQGAVLAGRSLEIAQGFDAKGDTIHLVRDEVVTYSPEISSVFQHSQNYITTQLIPQLEKEAKSLLFTGSKEDAKKQAENTGKPVYWSMLSPDDENFGMMNYKVTKSGGKIELEPVYYTNQMDEAPEGNLYYQIILPTDYNSRPEDRIADFCQSQQSWIEAICLNEQEKLGATELLKNFSVDGGTGLTYGEDFSSDITSSAYFKYPWSNIGNVVVGVGRSFTEAFAKAISSAEGGKADDKSSMIIDQDVHLGVTGFKMGLTPVLVFDINGTYGMETKYNRKESFTISMDKRSHLDFDVYRVNSDLADGKAAGDFDIFVEKNISELSDDVIDEIKGSMFKDEYKKEREWRYSRGFVYRTRGGATCRPYEGERVTQVFNTGTVLDEATKKIENPIIKLDKQSVSGVPFGEPARFTIYMTNDSELPEAAYPYFDLLLDETSNPKGAKLMIDGMPLSGNARTMEVRPGQVTEKTLEVYASEDFDYENLRLVFRSQGDNKTVQKAQFSVHYLQGAGPVEIAMPGDKWIMNTDAAYDKQRGWHMPVIISGFDKNQKNFDHIEFQYKESTRGDDYWTNLCAFYADSTYYRPASGTKAMIPENGNIITDFYGEGVVMEKAYDLRAVLFCRNGNSYLTSTSKVLSGVKDTRRPQLFGMPDPQDGILGAGENIVFNFSEPIEHNYLRETTNFEVKGETNETSIQEEPALEFKGKGYAQSEARRNFSEKSVTIDVMVKPDQTNTEMPIFSHGTDGKQLQLWLTGDQRLKAVVDDQTLTMDQPIKFAGGYKQVAMVLNHEQKKLTLYVDTLSKSLDSVTYSGYGPLIFGSTNQTDVNKRKYYQGRMLQARVWTRAFDRSLLNFYGNKQLTGYEMGLTDYYPMNEGRGNFATDEAQGAHLTLAGASWAQPRGMSLRLDWDEQREVKGMHLKENYFSRTSEEDYTLMFWFKTTPRGRGALLSNGSGRKTDVGAENRFFIGFEADTLKYRSNGMEYKLGIEYSDDDWHHYAMTVNRAHQVASIYIDNVLKAQFATENLGGMGGTDFYLGNMVWFEQGIHDDVMHQYNPLTGNIDGLCLFEQALPTQLIKRYSTKALGGSEKGLKVYLDFNRQERQKNGDLVLRPYTLSQVIHYDLDGKDTGRRDTVFYDTDEYMQNHVDQSLGAPVQAYEELRNLNFSYVGRDNQLLVNLDELDSRINKRSVYVTVYDIPDLNGNYMASPATVGVFVDRNPLRWEQRIYKTTMPYDPKYDFDFSVNVINNSGAAHTYTVENLPRWLTVNNVADVIEPKSEQELTFSINKDTNVGTYDHIIYLTDENGLSEPLMLNVSVQGKEPDWEVNSDMKNYSMSVVARVQIGDDIVTDSRDKVGVFDAMGRCLGVSNVNYNSQTAETMVYVTIFSNNSLLNDSLNFKLWHYATGKVMALQPSTTVNFESNGTVGTIDDPIVLRAGSLYIQTLELAKGWNWVSFNVYNKNFRGGINELLGPFNWQEGDILVDETNGLMLVYKNHDWVRNIKEGSAYEPDSVASKDRLYVANSYRVKVSEDINVELTGTSLKQPSERVITVKQGWNHIGYTPMVNLTVTSALADYFDQAEKGDVVKSKTEFAMFTVGANGSREWKGNLKYMKPGVGYMLKRQRQGTATFKYPFYEATASILENAASREMSAEARSYANTMTLAAVTDGLSLQEGDRLLALSEAEVRGEALLGDSVVYMSISGDARTPLSFAIERDGQIVATTGDVLTYEANTVSGSPDLPTRINFNPADNLPKEGWYTLQGVRLQSRPAKSGVYIYNGRKHIIR